MEFFVIDKGNKNKVYVSEKSNSDNFGKVLRQNVVNDCLMHEDFFDYDEEFDIIHTEESDDRFKLIPMGVSGINRIITNDLNVLLDVTEIQCTTDDAGIVFLHMFDSSEIYGDAHKQYTDLFAGINTDRCLLLGYKGNKFVLYEAVYDSFTERIAFKLI